MPLALMDLEDHVGAVSSRVLLFSEIYSCVEVSLGLKVITDFPAALIEKVFIHGVFFINRDIPFDHRLA